jgi:hypothetical protein
MSKKHVRAYTEQTCDRYHRFIVNPAEKVTSYVEQENLALIPVNCLSSPTTVY